jgi:MFS transporter, PAT family, beta-lactamase induction signal transducer AmpG
VSRPWILTESRPLRLFTLFILYVAQGVPIGLFWFAIPAWMAAKGAEAADVGYVLGLTALPWTLKLVNGFIMDRYTFLPMGRRRVWIVGAQLVMILLLIACAAVGPGVDDVLLLGIAGFAVNVATAFQDVAVDGLAVDIMEEEEHARASGMMFGGQSIGMAASTALAGMLIARFGPSAAYLFSAGFIGLITLYVLVLRERPGERLVPWGQGDAHPRNRDLHLGAWRPILGATLKAMIRPISLLWVPVLIVRGTHYGVFTGATPLMGTGEVGWSEAEVTSVVGIAQLVSGLIGMTLGGWLGDRFGAKRSSIAIFLVFMAMGAVMWFSVGLWSDPAHFVAFVYVWLTLNILLTVVSLPISMRLCDPRVAATQFTLYMATSNLGISLGAWVLGFSGTLGGLPSMFAIVFGLHAVGLTIMLVVKFPRRSETEAQVAAQLPEAPGFEPPHN